jgi:predicted phage-related endonuclease
MKRSQIQKLIREAITAKMAANKITNIIREEVKAAVKEGAVSDIDIVAQESATFDIFLKRVQQEFPEIGQMTPDVKEFLRTMYDEAK